LAQWLYTLDVSFDESLIDDRNTRRIRAVGPVEHTPLEQGMRSAVNDSGVT